MPFLTRFIASQAKTLPDLPDCDLSGRTFIVTGSNSGIGLEIVHHLAARKVARLVLAVRNLVAGQKAAAEIRSKVKAGAPLTIDVWPLDLASFANVEAFAKRCATLDRLDGVAMNAGILGGEAFSLTEDGHELVTQVNVLSPLYLALLLAPVLGSTLTRPLPAIAPLPTPFSPRIIFTGSAVAEVASTGGLAGSDPLKKLDDPKQYSNSDRYNQSKLLLHAMTRRLIPLFPELVITDVNPGFVETPLYRDSTGPAKFMVGKIGRTAEQGARNVSFALLTLERSTDWYHDCQPDKIHCGWLNSVKGKRFGDELFREACAEYRLVPSEAVEQ